MPGGILSAVIGGTIIARNYVPRARILAASFMAHHPNARFVTLVVDGKEDDRSIAGIGEVFLLDDLDVDFVELMEMAGIYDVMEFCTAVKPALLQKFLTLSDRACYIDPDIEVFSSFEDVFRLAAEHGLVLTPHMTMPAPRDGLSPSEQTIMLAGVFNLGFIAVGHQGRPMLEWWHSRLLRDALADHASAMFTDQRWVDWVPCLFSHVVDRDPGLNVAYWNLHERHLDRTISGEITANGEPLKFFHFSGYDPSKPWMLSKHGGDNPRCLLSDYPVAHQLCDSYAEKMEAAGIKEANTFGSYRFDVLPVGLRMTKAIRYVYRQALVAAVTEGSTLPPAPFASDGGSAFLAWLQEPISGTEESPLSRFQHAVWSDRVDLRNAFPNISGSSAVHYQTWWDCDPYAPRVEFVGATAQAKSTPNPTSAAPVRRPDGGWNVAGYLTAELGVGESGRRMARAIERVGLPVHYVGVSGSSSRAQADVRRKVSSELKYRNSLFSVNADQLPSVLALANEPWKADGRRIGYWFWEVDTFPEPWKPAFDALDEVWVSSEYTFDVLEPISPIPVRMVPLPMSAPLAPTPYTRSHLGMPEGFVFSFIYDYFSIPARKNPLDLLQAYTSAFGPDDGASLVLKSVNGHRKVLALDRLRQAAAGRPDVVIIDGYMTEQEVQGLIENSDCFVSLHRSEGFGLNIAAAMVAEKPVVATGYSGNMTFMDDTSAFLVPYDVVSVGPGNEPYPAEAHWAQPDLEAAARLMRTVFDNRPLAAEVAARGRAMVLDRQSIDRTVEAIRPALLPMLTALG